jgi:hypothetical protein
VPCEARRGRANPFSLCPLPFPLCELASKAQIWRAWVDGAFGETTTFSAALVCPGLDHPAASVEPHTPPVSVCTLRFRQGNPAGDSSAPSSGGRESCNISCAQIATK